METVDLLIQLFNESHQDEQWLIKLNRYERDNLLALINAIGWPAPWRLEKERRVPPDPNLGPWHSGDWMGQIGNKLQRSDGSVVIDEQDGPNYLGEPGI